MPQTPPRSRRSALFIAIPVIVLLLPLGYSLVSPLFAQSVDPEQGFLEKPDDPDGEGCVEDTTYMRLHHWELLTQIREEVVRYGKRGDIRLNNCQECHTSRERFCNKCHEAVNLYPECWGCHYYP